ncbi:MAG: FG-GAP repeat protein [Candidatus Cloacimonetes bacterium]|nr:FG-GAP repeat protein [Candidatus Cloacimonadota bacterium]
MLSLVKSRLLGKKLFLLTVFFLSTALSAAWDNEQKLTASDGAEDDHFGHSVSINGDYAVIGAYWDDDNGTNSGSAYIFHKSGTSWSEQAKLIASDGAFVDMFGWSVSIDGDYAVIGAYWDDNGSGSAYIFHRSGTTWTEQAKLTASDGADYDYFGSSVSISGDYAVIGANYDDESGSAYIFLRSGTIWTQQAKITASDGSDYDLFGSSVSIDGDYTVIGASRDNDNGSESGSAYFYSETPFPSPQNIQIEIIGTDVHLSWDAVTGANSYKVYSSDDPYTGFVEDTSGSFAGESWSAPIGDIKKFYYVIASTETIRSKDSHSQDAYHPE